MPHHRSRPSENDSNSWSFSDFFDLLAALLTTPGALNIPAPSTSPNEGKHDFERPEVVAAAARKLFSPVDLKDSDFTLGLIDGLPHQIKWLLITSYLGDDLPSLIQFSLTSKTNWLLVCSCPRRFIEVELTSSDCAIAYHGRSKHYLYDERFWGPLFEGSEVSRLRLDYANRRLPPLYADSLDIETADLCTVEILKKYLPKSGKYREMLLSMEVSGDISDGLIRFVRDSAEQLAYHILSHQRYQLYKKSYSRFQNTRLRFRNAIDWFDHGELVTFQRVLMREWINGGREIESMTFSFRERTARNIATWKSTHKGYDVKYIEEDVAVITGPHRRTLFSRFVQEKDKEQEKLKIKWENHGRRPRSVFEGADNFLSRPGAKLRKWRLRGSDVEDPWSFAHLYPALDETSTKEKHDFERPLVDNKRSNFTIDFFENLPDPVKRKIIPRLLDDLHSLVQFSLTSKANWQLICNSPRRFTEVELTLCGTCAMVFHRRARRCLYNKRFWGPLLQGSNVSKLHLKYPQNFDLPPLHADTLSITWLSPWTGAQLEKYKPKTGKFQEILLSKPYAIRLPIAQDFIDFMRDSAASTTITSR
ncbi:unnamed protein product, partial [Mesorhabditis spiculigera]